MPENIDANMIAWARDDLAECASQGVFRDLTPSEAMTEVSSGVCDSLGFKFPS